MLKDRVEKINYKKTKKIELSLYKLTCQTRLLGL